MLNKRPIFIVGFAHGGTNILLNLLRSHPGVCSPRGETQEVFRGKSRESVRIRAAKLVRYLPVLLIERRDVFSIRNFEPRPALSPWTRSWVDRTLHFEKLKALDPDQNLFKSENETYTAGEIRSSRILCKNIDGLIFLSREFSSMYRDATFFALVRDGLALCEGHIRRGAEAESAARNYEKGCQRMLEDSKIIENYHIIRYEELVGAPRETFAAICDLAGLDIGKCKKIRMQHKPVIDTRGEHTSPLDSSGDGVDERDWRYRQLHWYDLDRLGELLRTDLDANQRKRLSDRERGIIERECGASLRAFGYL